MPLTIVTQLVKWQIWNLDRQSDSVSPGKISHRKDTDQSIIARPTWPKVKKHMGGSECGRLVVKKVSGDGLGTWRTSSASWWRIWVLWFNCRVLPHIPLTLHLFIHFCFEAESHQIVQAVLKLVIRLPQTSRSFVLIFIFFFNCKVYHKSEIAKGYGVWLSGRGLSWHTGGTLHPKCVKCKCKI